MARLYLLRHAHSDVRSGETDFERTLNARGERAAGQLGPHFDRVGAPPQRVLCSSARRAEQTWHRLASAGPLGGTSVGDVTLTDRLYLASAAELLGVLREQPDELESLLVIAHNPGIHELAMALAGEGDRNSYDRLAQGIPEAGLCELAFDGAWSQLRPGAARLVRFDVPGSTD